MNSDTLLFVLALGGASLLLIACGLRLMRKYPHIKHRPSIADEDPNLYAVAMRAWQTGRPQVGTVDSNGNLTIREVSEPEQT